MLPRLQALWREERGGETHPGGEHSTWKALEEVIEKQVQFQQTPAHVFFCACVHVVRVCMHVHVCIQCACVHACVFMHVEVRSQWAGAVLFTLWF